MGDLTYRAATADDAATIANLRWEMETERHEAHEGHVTQAAFLAQASDIVRSELARGGYRAWVAEADGQVVACVVLMCWPVMPSLERLQRSRGMVSSVYTKPDYRRQGVARRLMDTLIADCRQRKMQRLILWASEMGRPLYEDMGFAPSRGHEFEIELGDDADCNLP